MKIVFSLRAKTDLAEFVKLIACDKPQAARKWVADMRQSVLKLSDFPKIGRIVPEYGDETLREIIKGQYRIVYRIDDKNDAIVIVTIPVHAYRFFAHGTQGFHVGERISRSE